jgi:hypothetical protein
MHLWKILEQEHRKMLLSDEQSSMLDVLKDDLIPMGSYNIHQRVTGMFEKNLTNAKDASEIMQELYVILLRIHSSQQFLATINSFHLSSIFTLIRAISLRLFSHQILCAPSDFLPA